MTGQHEEGGGRRRFFQQALGRLVEPVAGYIERRLDLTDTRTLLRPPGAIDEEPLIDACHRCGKCVEACPVDAIFSLGKGAGKAAGTPVIDPDRAACVACEGLYCTHVCPSGALMPLNSVRLIRMGLAEVYESLCVRSEGESCSKCVDLCPLGETAIRLVGAGPPQVLADGCVGCGVCQQHCPTSPKAITVRPLP